MESAHRPDAGAQAARGREYLGEGAEVGGVRDQRQDELRQSRCECLRDELEKLKNFSGCNND